MLTPGDEPDVLVAMNPAALKANLADLPRGATIIANTDEFSKRNLAKVGYPSNPLEDGTLESYHVHALALTSITVEALAPFDLTRKDKERSTNMFALGLLSWLYTRPISLTERFLTTKFGAKPESSRPTSRRCEPGSTTARRPRTSPTATRSGRPR